MMRIEQVAGVMLEAEKFGEIDFLCAKKTSRIAASATRVEYTIASLSATISIDHSIGQIFV
jgi:hypothetical protein